MMTELTQIDFQSLLDLAYDHWHADNWDDAIKAEQAAEKFLAGREAWFPIWRDLIDYLDLFYRHHRRALTHEEAVAWMMDQRRDNTSDTDFEG